MAIKLPKYATSEIIECWNVTCNKCGWKGKASKFIAEKENEKGKFLVSICPLCSYVIEL